MSTTKSKVTPNIRTAKEHDYAALSCIFAEENAFHAALVPEFIKATDNVLTKAEFKEMLAHPEQVVLVAEMDSVIIGAVLVAEDAADAERWIQPRRFAYIEELVVTARWRGQGIGRALLDSVDEWAKNRGLNEIELHVWQNNHRATNFYTSIGYENVRHSMRKHLNDKVS